MKKRAVTPLGLLFAALLAGCADTEATTPGSAGASGNSNAGTSSGGSSGSAGSTGAQGGTSGSAPESICDKDAATELTLVDIKATQSCSLSCPKPCDVIDNPWHCPALDDYFTLPHDCADNACGKWDGQYPKVVKGQCTASTPTGEAIEPTRAFGTPVILPDGRRLLPAGNEFLFPNKWDPNDADDDELEGTFPYSAIRVPGSRFVVVSDAGVHDHVLRVLDVELLSQGQDPILSEFPFGTTDSLNYGLAMTSDGILLASSGAPESVIRAFTIDPISGQLSRLEDKDIQVQNGDTNDAFPQGIAISPDGKKLLVGQVKRSNLLVFSLEPGNYGQRVASIELGTGASDQFSVAFRPASNDEVFASLWMSTRVARVNLTTQEVSYYDVGKQPEEMLFLDQDHLVIAGSLTDSITIVNLATDEITQVDADPTTQLPGSNPSTLAYDETAGRLYVTLSGRNAVSVFNVSFSGASPQLSPAGMIPTAWWPTDVIVGGPADPDPGALIILNGKGHGTGPTLVPELLLTEGISVDQMRGSIQHIAKPDDTTLGTHSDKWADANKIATRTGYPKVSCADGASYDFPVPETNTEGPSKQIKHVVFIVRENKTFDAIFGDVAGLEGDPSLVMAPGQMENIWPNLRRMAKEFTHGDNFYEDAEQSIQGHFWTAFGRMTDYSERTWLTTWGRGTRGPLPLQGTAPETHPLEGSLFAWLDRNNVAFDKMGELLGGYPLDPHYGALGGLVTPGSTQPETNLACYMAARVRVMCDLKPFTYAWYPNDHTLGATANSPNPGIFIATNDEATGMFVDALSHSPMWKDSLVVIVEDDPQDGGDHIDSHRTIVVMASPWVKRGYVSKTHFDITSVHKLFAHILGLPYNNVQAQDAPLPLDMFTSTPDYTPFVYTPLKYDNLSCNPEGTPMSNQAKKWDFSRPDEQPGLGRQVWKMLHNMPDTVDDDD